MATARTESSRRRAAGRPPERWRRWLGSLPAITLEGQVLAALLMANMTLLLVTGHLLLYFSLAVGLGLLAVGFGYPYLNTRRVQVRRGAPANGFAGEALYFELAVANRRWLSHAYSLLLTDDKGSMGDNKDCLVHVPVVRAGQAVRIGYYATFPRRGLYRLRFIKVSSSFPFLLFNRARLIRYPSEIVVYPRPGRLKATALPLPRGSLRAARQRARGYQDFRGLREYRYGEDAKLIHWKSSARTGEPVVREFDAEGGDSVLVVLDPMLEGDARRLVLQERAISFCLTLVRDLWRKSYRVAFACMGSGYYQVVCAQQKADFAGLLNHLAHYVSRGDFAVEDVLARVRLPRRAETSLIIVTDDPAMSGRQAERLWSTRGAVRAINVDEPEFGDLFEETTGRVYF